MLPGGEAAVMRIVSGGAIAEARMVVVDLETGASDTLGFATRVAYASGHLVFSGADGTLLAQPFDPVARQTTGQAVAILDGVSLAGPGLGEFALSAEGGLAYQPGGVGGAEGLAIGGASGRTGVPLPQSGDLEDPSFSPDGRRIAMRFNDVGENTDIWIFDRDQGTLERFTEEGDFNGVPVWTKDGARVAFASDRDGGEPQLYWRPSDRSASAERLLVTDYAVFPGSWFPDEPTVAFQANRDSWDIGFLTVGDSLPRWVLETEFNEIHPQISPDGLWLAYTSDRSGSQEVYVVAASGEGGQYTVSTNGGSSPRWAPDGGALYYVAGGTLVAASFSTDGGFRVTQRVNVLDGVTDLDDSNVNYDVHPDGEDFVVINQGGGGPDGVTQLIWILNWPEIIQEMTTGR
jgi:Tol biopolymer transport system component